METNATGTSTQDLADIGALAQRPSLEGAVQATLDVLGVDLAYATLIDGAQQRITVLRGDGSVLGLAEGRVVPFANTYCHRVLNGRLQSIVPDVRADDRARSVGLGAGALAIVPLAFTGGEVQGTLCAISREARPDLGYRDLQVLRVLARIATDELEREVMRGEVADARARTALLEALVAATEARDGSDGMTAAAVGAHAIAVARRLELDEDEVADVARVAVVHDVGKLLVADGTLHRTTPLTEAELELVRSHSEAGAQVIGDVPELAHLEAAVRAGHERWDGTGYPDGLAGSAIPMPARIVGVCHAYHAMMRDRPYRGALAAEEAATAIEAGLGTQFCPIAGRAFLNVLAGR